jgi:hypothetical protein
MPTSRPQTAFLAAALVLLVLPVLVMLGLSALGIAAHLGMMDQTGFAPRSYDALMSIVSG